MALELLDPPGVARSPRYSHVALARGPLAFVSGQVALDPDGNVVGVGDMGAQADQVFRNLAKVLAGIGASFADVAKFTYFVTDFDEMAAVREVRDKYVSRGVPPPASTAVEVSRLARPEFMLEVEAIVVLRAV